MDTIHLKAHYDGEKILLDEPFNIEPNTKLIAKKGVTPLQRRGSHLDL